MISVASIIQAHGIVDMESKESTAKTRIDCANFLLPLVGYPNERARTEADAIAVMLSVYHGLLNTNQYQKAAILCWGTSLFDPRPYFVQKIWNVIRNHRKWLIQGCGSAGKCLRRGSKVLMHDGTTKNVEDIQVGEFVMGDDSSPRKVLSLARGKSEMFRVVPKRGESWVCTKDHILTLRCTENKPNGDGKTISSNYRRGNILDVSASEFSKSSWTKSYLYKQFSVGVNFPSKPTQFDPYIYGLWLGDGGVNNPVLYNMDSAIVEAWCRYFSRLNYKIRIHGVSHSKCCAYFVRLQEQSGNLTPEMKETKRKLAALKSAEYRKRKRLGLPFTGQRSYGAPNPFLRFVKSSFIKEEKRILKGFLINDRESRLKLLAGILDTDGYAHGTGFEITTKYAGLCEDIKYLARSLGFSAQSVITTKTIKSLGFSGKYHRIAIGGRLLSEIPTLIKKIQPRKSNVDPNASSITLEPLPEEDYYGFMLDGNGRFLLGDFTVTHNSYCVMAHDILDWSRDPHNTTTKIISTTAGHARAQTFSLLVRFHRDSIVPMPGYIRQGFIGLDKDDRRSSISELAIDKGSELEGKSGKLQGFHPLPRKKEHPIFGKMSRVRARLDEAEDVPSPVWPGITNMMLTMGTDESVSVGGMYNPKRRDSAVAQRAEPIDGWGNFDIERDEEWESKKGFHVLRLDGKRCENVIQKKIIYPGLIDWEGYNQYPPEHPDHATFSRGAYPTQSMAFNVISQADLDQSIGTFIWSSRFTPYNWATLDCAFEEGGDAAIMTAGLYGEAIGFLPQGRPLITFKSPKWVVQYEQQFELKKQRVQLMAKDIMRICRSLHVTPEWFALDRTSNNLCDLLYDWGDVLGIQWGQKATEVKILEEDSERAIDLYDDVVTEMWFAFTAWLEFGYIAFSPGMEVAKLFSQFTSRKYQRISKVKKRLESKKAYKKRLGVESCDEADSAVEGVHLIRLRAPKDQVHAMEPEKRYVEREDDYFREGAIHSAPSESEIDRMEILTTD